MSLIIKELLQIGESALQKAGCSDTKIDAELLMCHLLSINKTQLFIKSPNLLDEKSCEEYFKLIDIRAGGMPVQYITGEQEFMGIPFKVNEHVLIPRQDTETLVEEVMSLVKEGLKNEKKPPSGGYLVLDLCCGSGAVGVSLCKHQNNVKVTASDISKKALEVAKENAQRAGVDRRIRFCQSDLFASLKKGLGRPKFHMIVSNPPYIESAVIPTLQREVALHEPMIALDGGEDGLDFYRKIFDEAPSYLRKNGMLFLEMGHDQGAALTELALLTRQFEDIVITKDLAGLDRVFTCRLSR